MFQLRPRGSYKMYNFDFLCISPTSLRRVSIIQFWLSRLANCQIAGSLSKEARTSGWDRQYPPLDHSTVEVAYLTKLDTLPHPMVLGSSRPSRNLMSRNRISWNRIFRNRISPNCIWRKKVDKRRRLHKAPNSRAGFFAENPVTQRLTNTKVPSSPLDVHMYICFDRGKKAI